MSGHGSSGNSNEGEGSESKLRAVEDIKKLSPSERIQRLKELEEERKKEIEEAESLIRETVREIEEAEEKKIIPIPEARATDLATLDTVEERQLVATHHFLTTETAASTTPQSQQQQKKSLEEVAAEEAPTAQQHAQLTPQQMQGFRKPEYGLGSGQQRSGLAEYISKTQQTATSAGLNTDGSPMEEKVRDFYQERAETGETGGPQEKYFGSQAPVTDSYHSRRTEKEKHEQADVYRRRAGPA